jgi:hypothetical protein
MNREKRRERKTAAALSNFGSLERYIGRGESVERKKYGRKATAGSDYLDSAVSRLAVQENADRIRRMFMTHIELQFPFTGKTLPSDHGYGLYFDWSAGVDLDD